MRPGRPSAAPVAYLGVVKMIIASTSPECFFRGDDLDYEIDTPLVPRPVSFLDSFLLDHPIRRPHVNLPHLITPKTSNPVPRDPTTRIIPLALRIG